MCDHYNRYSVSEIQKFERELAEGIVREFAAIPTETWGWSKDQMPVVHQGEKGRMLTTRGCCRRPWSHRCMPQ